MNLIEVLKAGKKHIKTLKFPGTEFEVGLCVLTDGEVQDAVFSTEQRFKEKGIEITATTLATYNRELNTQMLFRALVDPLKQRPDGTYEPIFKKVDELRLATADQKNELIEEYNAFEAQCSPSPVKMTDDEFDALFEDIKKNPLTGNDLSLQTARRLILYLASRPQNLPKDSGSISLH